MEEGYHHSAQHHSRQIMDRPGELKVVVVGTVKAALQPKVCLEGSSDSQDFRGPFSIFPIELLLLMICSAVTEAF